MEPAASSVTKTSVINSFFNKVKTFFGNNRKYMLPGIMIVVAIVTILWGAGLIGEKGTTLLPEKWDKLVIDQKYTPAFTLVPSETRRFGIISQETFTLKTKDAQSEDFIRSNLISSKPVSVSRISDNEFRVVPTGALGIEETISMSIKSHPGYSWVFQTAPKFKVASSLPENQAKNVPTNTGIEITFNNDSYNFTGANLDVEPKFDYRIEKHDEVTALIPANPLQTKTTYKVTVKRGSGLLSGGNVLSEDFSFSFQTGEEDVKKGRLNLAKSLLEVFPDEPVMAKVYANEDWAGKTYNTEVYKFASADDFLASRANVDRAESSWEEYFGEKDVINTGNLARVFTAVLTIQSKENIQYLQLPQNLDEGFYLVQFWFDDHKKVEQLWVQSGSIAGYLSVGKLQTVVWVNSAKGENLESSNVQLLGTGNSYSVNNEGWAAFPTPSLFMEDERHYIKVTSPVGGNLILPVNELSGRSKPEEIMADDYWSYLYHERILYKPSDTVYFWGVAKDRDSGSPAPGVDIYLGDTLKTSARPGPDGTFIGKIALTDEPVGFKNIDVRVSGKTISGSYFQVTNYVKPELKIEVEGNKKAVFAGETVDYKSRVTFFDGTPASNVKLYLSANYSGGGNLDKSEASADKNGYVSFKYQTKVEPSGYYPRYEGVTVSAVKSGEGPSDGSSSVFVYGSSFQIATETSQNGDQANMKIKVNTLDLGLVNNQGKDSPVSGVAKNQKVQLTNTRIWWEPVKTGTYYDFVEKTTRPTFDYKRHEDVIESKDFYTNDQGAIDYTFTMEKGMSYNVKVVAVDGGNRPAEGRGYFYFSDYQTSGQKERARLNIERDSNYFSLGDEADITIQKSGSLYAKTDASKFLFIVANRGSQDVYVTQDPELKLIFGESYIPNVSVASIIFNGKGYEEVDSTCKSGWACSGYDYYNSEARFDPVMLAYQKNDSKLDVVIELDKTKYQPGENTVVTVGVNKNGNPVSGATVQLTLVDEALAAIGGVKEPSTLSDLYKQVGNHIYYNYYSHRPVFPDGPQAERGGGGGGRDLFKDTAFFGTGTTDSGGKATFNIKLPDNITNWLTYAQAVTQGVDAGYTKSSVIATKEFFVTSQFPNTVTEKDEAFVAASSFGNVLNEGSKIPVMASFSKGSQIVAESSTDINAFKEAYFGFPKLPAGDYKVTVGGKYQSYQDAVTLPLKVIQFRLDFAMAKSKTLDKGDKIDSFADVSPALGKPIKLVVSDEGKGKYYYDLYRYCFQNSNRLEKRVASIKADQVLASRFEDADCVNYEGDLTDFQNEDGGLKQVVWGDSDLETTVWAMYVDSSLFDKNQLMKYLQGGISTYSGSEKEKSILKNWGLTLLGRPDLNELDRLATSATTFKEKLLAAMALYSAGNTQFAKQMYYGILEQYAYTNKPYLRIQADPKKSDYGNYALDTAYTLLLGTVVGSEYNQGFSLYLRDYSWYAEDVVLDIANISYLDYILASLPDKDTTVSFKSALKNITRNITKEGALAINISRSEFEKFTLSVSEGKAEASLNYFASPEEFAKQSPDSRLSLKKKVAKVKGSQGGDIKVGDILQVTLHYDFESKAPEGCYMLTDHVPSGFVFLDNPDNYDLSIGEKGSLYPEKANVVKGCAYNSVWWRKFTQNDSVYFLRAIGAGKFIEEPAIIQASVDPSVFQKTQEGYITVEK